jgi:DNA polymerase
VADFRKANPLVTGLWRSLQAALEESVGKDLELELPSGRKLSYRAVTVEKKTVTDPETGKPYQKTVLKASVDGIRTTFYGGLLAENLVQAVSRDAFSVNMLALDRAGIQVLWSVHDEAVCLVSGPEEAEKARQIMATTPEWLAGCPVDAEVSISDRFKK